MLTIQDEYSNVEQIMQANSQTESKISLVLKKCKDRKSAVEMFLCMDSSEIEAFAKDAQGSK